MLSMMIMMVIAIMTRRWAGTDPYDATSYPGSTDPTMDSDGDGYSDEQEELEGTDPADSSSYPGSAGSTTDSDSDGYSDEEEMAPRHRSE